MNWIRQKLGPLELWQWAAIALALVAAFLWFRSRGGGASDSSSSGAPASTTPSGLASFGSANNAALAAAGPGVARPLKTPTRTEPVDLSTMGVGRGSYPAPLPPFNYTHWLPAGTPVSNLYPSGGSQATGGGGPRIL